MSTTTMYFLKLFISICIVILLFIDLRKNIPINELKCTHGVKLFIALGAIFFLWLAGSAVQSALNGEAIKPLVLIIFLSLGLFYLLILIYVLYIRIIWDNENLYISNPFYFWKIRIIPCADIVSLKKLDSRMTYIIKTDYHGKLEFLMFMTNIDIFIEKINFHIRNNVREI